jgi:hypothetical protein
MYSGSCFILATGINACGEGIDMGLSRLGDAFLHKFNGSSTRGIAVCSNVGVMAGELKKREKR